MTMPVSSPPLVLASGSASRRMMLESAGLTPKSVPPAVDEAEIKSALWAEQAPVEEAAVVLAEMKASRVARRFPEALVLGADQMLECDGVWFDKPESRAAARDQLLALSGKTHRLISAAVVIHKGERIWHQVAEARMAMRPLSEPFIDWYLDQVGDAVQSTVGCYQIEGLGVQLFNRVQGDHFVIRGLPLLPLLDFLRQWKVVQA
ncbi:Maf family protein [Novispirillum itersonii]|uniref:Maf family protein n=1 Tax=Novispirillum itersonii TaxID=189 RepID=UPI00036EF1B0|nr:Maf family protein [Novispirillum itersonii]